MSDRILIGSYILIKNSGITCRGWLLSLWFWISWLIKNCGLLCCCRLWWHCAQMSPLNAWFCIWVGWFGGWMSCPSARSPQHTKQTFCSTQWTILSVIRNNSPLCLFMNGAFFFCFLFCTDLISFVFIDLHLNKPTRWAPRPWMITQWTVGLLFLWQGRDGQLALFIQSLQSSLSNWW